MSARANTQGPNPGVVKQICGEIAAMEYSGDIKAIAVAIIDKDGDVRTLVAYDDKMKMPIIAAVSILQHSVIGEARETKKDRDI